MKNLSEPVKNINIFPSDVKLINCTQGWKGHTINRSASMFFYVLEGGFVLDVGDYSGFVKKNQLLFLLEGKEYSFWLMRHTNLTMLELLFT